MDDAAEGRVSGRFAAGYGLELLDCIPLDLNRDPLRGALLGDDLIDAFSNSSISLGSPHALEVKALQTRYRALDSLVTILLVTLLLLARSVPVQTKPLAQMIRAHRAFDDVEDLLVPIRPLAQYLLPAHIAGKHRIRKRLHLGARLWNDGDEEPTFGIDRA